MTRSRPDGKVDFGYAGVQLTFLALSLRLRRRTLLVCALMGLGVALITLAALGSGAVSYSFGEVLAALINHPDAGIARVVVVEWRLPRALAAVVFGAALGAAGAIFQSLTRNPLASPDIIGFSTGAHTGALLVITLAGGGYLLIAGGALTGGLATAALVYALAWRRGVQGFRLIVVGIAISAMLGSLNTWLMLNADLEVALTAAVWGAGSLNAISMEQMALGSAVIAVLLLASAALSRSLRQAELGDDTASATGVRNQQVRLWSMVIGVGLVASVTAAAGPIAFIALAAPQISRRMVRSPGVAIAPAAFMGALLLCAADYTALHLLPITLPVGLVTAAIGGTYLVVLIVSEVRRRV